MRVACYLRRQIGIVYHFIFSQLLDDTGAKSFQMDVRSPWIAAGDFNSCFGLDLALKICWKKYVGIGCEKAEAWGNDGMMTAGQLTPSLPSYPLVGSKRFNDPTCK
jgi:hypothetical protein